MDIFYILVGASVIGVAAVFWLLKNEKDAAGEPLRDSDLKRKKSSSEPAALAKPESPLLNKFLDNFLNKLKFGKKEVSRPSGRDTQEKPSMASWAAKIPELLKKLGIGKKNVTEENTGIPGEEPLPPTRGYLERQKEGGAAVPNEVIPLLRRESKTGSASMMVEKTDEASLEGKLTSSEEEKIDKEIELTSQLNELKEKHETLDRLFKEKSAALEKSEEALQNELKNRKEFNKVKDILEKELKETKDKARSLQVDLNNAGTEAEGHKSRVNQLEERVTKLQKTILEKDDEINNLLKRLQTFASPGTPSTPISIEQPAQAPQAQEAAPQQPPAASPPETAPQENKGNDKGMTETTN